MQAAIRRDSDPTGPTPSQWQRLKPILEQCQALPAEQRESLLLRELADDPAMIELALQILAANPAETETSAVLSAGKHVDQRAGKFRLHHIIGEGGCGVVYEATRIDPSQRVAVKILKRTTGQESFRDRFEREARILSSMQHPNIVRFLDWGDVDGLPFFAMEFVAGQKIDTYCCEKKLLLRDRLRLFQDVCSGIQYAHRHEIVHRDLKPGNILVSSEFGQVKLLDFGIAKLMEPQFWDSTPLTSPSGFQPKTLAWASPEQLEDLPATAASDIYSLGLLLRHLLTGNTAAETRGKPVSVLLTPEMAAQMQERSLASLQRKVSGDLDLIIARAMAVKPEDRYRSAAHLSDDIDNYLNGKAVTAHPDSRAYRALKFTARHRILVTSIVIAFLALAIGLGTARYHQLLADKARVEADLRRQEAEQKKREAENLNQGITTMVSRLGVVLEQIQREQTEKLAKLYEDVGQELERARNYSAAHKLWDGARNLWEKLDNRARLRAASEQVGRLQELAAQKSSFGAAAGRSLSVPSNYSIPPDVLGEIFLTQAQILRSSGRLDEAAKTFEKARGAFSGAPEGPRKTELMRQLDHAIRTH